MGMDALYEKSKAQLERDEGRLKKLYYDTLQIPTIGIGFNLKEGLDDYEIDLIFQNRWDKLYTELHERLPWVETLDEARLGVLMNMAYNLGVPRLLLFKNMLAAISEGKWQEAKAHALNSIWHSQVGARASRLADQLLVGEWR